MMLRSVVPRLMEKPSAEAPLPRWQVTSRSRDRGLESMVAPYQHALESLQMEGGRERPSPELSRLRWMIEEFRISLFAQNLRTLIPVSAKRLDAQLARARKEHADS